MKFRNKILFSIYGVVLGFLVITFFFINYWARERIEDTFADELRTSSATLNVLLRQQGELLLRGCMVIAESPRLKAVTELRDPATAYQASMEITQTSLNDLFLLTDDHGDPLVQILQGQKVSWDIGGLETISRAIQKTASTDMWLINGSAYKIATAPVKSGDLLQGTLTIGFRYIDSDIRLLRKAVNCDMTLALDTNILFSTLFAEQQHDVRTFFRQRGIAPMLGSEDRSVTVFAFAGAEESYLAAGFRLPSPSAAATHSMYYLMMKPVGQAVREGMRPVYGTFAFVSVIFLIITFIVGTVISRGISKPVGELVTGAAEIGRGNYDHRIKVAGRDEMSVLARQFGAMSASLKEKMTQLDELNRDLVGRNEALDEALRQLQNAQQEIVRNERLAATGKLTAQLAHEINNPIHNIQSCLKTALERLPHETRGKELIDVAYDEIGRMSRLTRQMLDFYRTSIVESEMTPLQINTIMTELVSAFSTELTERGIECRADISGDIPEISGSPDKLKQVFMNLLLNARDAMPDGGVLSVSTRLESDRIRIVVADTGIGIPQENIGRIFDAFFTTKSKVSGVGLGLSVTYGIIGQHKGSIDVTSEVGTGTMFTVFLPVA